MKRTIFANKKSMYLLCYVFVPIETQIASSFLEMKDRYLSSEPRSHTVKGQCSDNCIKIEGLWEIMRSRNIDASFQYLHTDGAGGSYSSTS